MLDRLVACGVQVPDPSLASECATQFHRSMSIVGGLTCHDHHHTKLPQAASDLAAIRFVCPNDHSNSTIQVEQVVKMFLRHSFQSRGVRRRPSQSVWNVPSRSTR